MVASDASVSVESIYVGGNVEGNIVVGNNNVVYSVHNHYGALVDRHAPPSVRRHRSKQAPPRLPADFIGRANDLERLTGHIRGRQAVLVYGRDGIGKTALVRQAANSGPAKAMRDGVVYLQGVDEKGETLGVHDTVQLLFDALYESNPPLKVTAASARTRLSKTQPLIVLNRFEFSSAGLSELADLFPQGALVVTSRNAPGEDGLQHLKLSPLARQESIQLLTSKAGIALDEQTRDPTDKTCELLGDVPLAISKTANLIRENRMTLTDVLGRLHGIRPPSQGDAISAAIERSFGLAYSLLDWSERQALAIAAAAPGLSVDRAWLESLSGEATKALESLELLQANSPRLRLPEGMREVIQSGRDIQSLRESYLGHLLYQLQSRSLEFEFVADELGNILGLLQWAANEKHWAYVIGLGRAVDAYLTLHGLWDAWEQVLKQVLVAAENMQDLPMQAWALHQLGTREIGVGTRDQAVDLLVRALDMREAQGDTVGAAYTRHNLNLILAPKKSDRPDPSKWIGPGLLGVVLIIALFLYNWLNPTTTPECPTPEGWQVYRVREADTLESISQRVAFALYGEGGKGKQLAVVRLALADANCFDSSTELEKGRGVYVPIDPAGTEATPGAEETPVNPGVAQSTLSLELAGMIEGADAFQFAGDVIHYSYDVWNVGNDPLQGPVSVMDEKATVTCPQIDSLGPEEMVNCTGVYTITQADLDFGSVTNRAVARVGGMTSDPASLTIEGVQNVELTFFKEADPPIYDHVDETITYRYTILNSGNVTLSPVQIVLSDDHLLNSEPFMCGPQAVELAPNQAVTCTASYSITAADVDARSVTNKAIGEVFGLQQHLAIALAPASTTIHYALPIALTSMADPKTYDRVGQTIVYTYTLKNNNRVSLQGGATIEADKGTAACPDIQSLPANGTVTCTGQYIITQADLDEGSVTNNSAASIGGMASEVASTTIYADPHPALAISNTADPTTYDHVDQPITYTYVITNAGNVTLDATNFDVRDDRMGTETPVACASDRKLLAPSETLACTTLYTISQTDADIGSVTNTVTVSTIYRRSTVSSEPAVFTITYACPFPPADWTTYIIRSGDTLSEIGSWYRNITVPDLQRANCMGLSTALIAGDKFYVPYLASITGIVFADPNSNGIQDAGEPILPGFTVPIRGRNINDSVQTDANGRYTFTNLPPGSYFVLYYSENLTSPETKIRNFGLRPVP